MDGKIFSLCRNCRNVFYGEYELLSDREGIIEAAKILANEVGLLNLTRLELCTRLRIGTARIPITLREIVELIRDEVPLGDELKLSRNFASLKKAAIVDTTIALIEESGFRNLTSAAIAAKLGVTDGLVRHYFHMNDLIDEAVRVAVKRKNVKVMLSAGGNGYDIREGSVSNL